MATHQIWGNLDPLSDSSCSASHDHSTEFPEPEFPEPKQRRARSLPADLDIRHVVFNDESRSSDFLTTSDESGSAEAHLAAVGIDRTPSPRQAVEDQYYQYHQQHQQHFQQRTPPRQHQHHHHHQHPHQHGYPQQQPRVTIHQPSMPSQPSHSSRPAGSSRRATRERPPRANDLLYDCDDEFPPEQQLQHDGGGGDTQDDLDLDGVDGDGDGEGDRTLAEGEQWSKGSNLHDSGKCKPCHYVHTKLGCLSGQDCNFCHIPHSKKSRPRPCKTKRMQCKRIVSMLEAASARDPEQFAEATRVLSSQSTYLRSVLKTKNQDDAREVGAGAENGVTTSSTAASTEIGRSSPGGAVPEGLPAQGNQAATDKPALVSALLTKLKGEQTASRSSGGSTKVARGKRAAPPPP